MDNNLKRYHKTKFDEKFRRYAQNNNTSLQRFRSNLFNLSEFKVNKYIANHNNIRQSRNIRAYIDRINIQNLMNELNRLVINFIEP